MGGKEGLRSLLRFEVNGGVFGDIRVGGKLGLGIEVEKCSGGDFTGGNILYFIGFLESRFIEYFC